MAQAIKQRYVKTELVEWRKIKPLQPDNFKLNYNNAYLTYTHDKFGISDVLKVWEDVDGTIYTLDGHQRIEEYHNREDMPEKIWANFYHADNRKEAIQMLLEVYNQKHNPIDGEVMTEFLEVEEIPVQELAVQSLNFVIVEESEEDIDPSLLGDEFDLPDGDREPFQQMTFTLADEQASKIKEAVSEIKKMNEFKYCETFGNENGNGNALYLIIMQWVEQKKLY